MALVLGMLAPLAQAVETVTLQLGRLEGDGWHAQGVTVTVGRGTEGRLTVTARADRVVLPEPVGSVADVELTCPGLVAGANDLRCPTAEGRAGTEWLGQTNFEFGFRYARRSQRLAFQVTDLPLLNGDWALEGEWSPERLVVRTQGQIDAAHLVERLQRFPLPMRLEDPQGALRINARLDAQQTAEWSVSLSGEDLALSDPAGLHAAQGLELQLRGSMKGAADERRIELEGSVDGGEAYVDPVYMTFDARPLRFSAAAIWHRSGEIGLERLQLEHGRELELTAQGELAVFPEPCVKRLSLEASSGRLGTVYQTYLRPFLFGTPLSDLALEGNAALQTVFGSEAPNTYHLSFRDVRVEDQKKRFDVHGLAGDLSWAQRVDEQNSWLLWEQAHVFGWTLGGARARVVSAGNRARLAEPLSIPIWDGELRIDQLNLTNPGTPQMSWSFGGVLSPIAMEKVTEALGWPQMAGQLSGVIPEVSYSHKTVSVDGTLLVRVFDGAVLVKGLEIARPFGIAPTLGADVEVQSLNLDALTRRFAFGKIQGGLAGYVRDLQMVDWRPVAFDARLETPQDDPLPHRISQRAVENISRLSGGVTGIVSQGFLSLFEEFSYHRIGLGCRLSEGVCEMSGLGPAEDGYMIVKGGGLPRINIVGYNREVAWDVLVQRLQNAIATSPVVR